MQKVFYILMLSALLIHHGGCHYPAAKEPLTAAGKPSEGPLELFSGAPEFTIEQIFTGGRFPNITVTTHGTILATWGQDKFLVRRSDDGGRTWGPVITVADPGFHGGGVTVDENTGDIIVFVEEKHPEWQPQKTMYPLSVFRSSDDGKNWALADVVIHPDERGNIPALHMHEKGITLRHSITCGKAFTPCKGV
jgi:sialidase-1